MTSRIAGACVAAVAVFAAAPGDDSTAAAATTFVERFDRGAPAMARFRRGVYHRDDHLVAQRSWRGDHDLACGPPSTTRTIRRNRPAESFYICKQHLMTSVGDTSGYSVAWFSPKRVFRGPGRVRWSVNVTDLGGRQWWEVAIVPARSRPISVISWLGAADLPTYPRGAVVLGNGPFGGSFHLHAAGRDLNPAGWRPVCGANALDPAGCASKMIRRPFSVTDRGDGTVVVRAFGRTTRHRGAFPRGPWKVVFKDHNYTPTKDGVPAGFTWHWDDIAIRSRR